MLCLFKNVTTRCFHLNFFSSSPFQYFETDDQEFYKTKVCFILNNDVSEMDLVFAEEKYSKSGQLEKVRRRFRNKNEKQAQPQRVVFSLRPDKLNLLSNSIHLDYYTAPLRGGDLCCVDFYNCLLLVLLLFLSLSKGP